jgi:hypothetical protein
MKVCKIPIQATLVMALLPVPPALVAEPTALRQHFLECERQASSTLMSFAEAARCSALYEQLLKGEFQGDFAKLLAWWQGQRSTPAPATAAKAARHR